nr:basic salivary proline-rich protein 2-like [Odocoileus virginianus texanus]
MPRPPFSAPARPPGAPSRRPPPLRSGSTGLCPGAEPEPRPPALRPLGTGPPRAHSETDTTLHARTHTVSHAHTHTMPPRSAHSDWPALGFAALGAIPSFLLLEGGWVTSPRRPDRSEERESREGPVVSGRRAGPGPRREPPARRRWAGRKSRRRVGPRWPPPREKESRGRQKNEALSCSAVGTKPTVPFPSAAPAPPPPPQGGRQVLGGPAPGPDPSLSRPPGSLFLSFLLPFPRSGRLRFLPRLSLKLRRSASSQNNKGQGGGDARREGAREGGRGSHRGTLGSVVRDAGEGSSAPRRPGIPEPPAGWSPRKAARPRPG